MAGYRSPCAPPSLRQVRELERLVEEHGVGQWAAILVDGSFDPHRTAVDLKVERPHASHPSANKVDVYARRLYLTSRVLVAPGQVAQLE